MKHDKDPVFRKIIVPWYDVDAVCAVCALAMIFVVLFALRGITIALQISDYPGFLWMPAALAGMSLYVFCSLAIRLLRRRMIR